MDPPVASRLQRHTPDIAVRRTSGKHYPDHINIKYTLRMASKCTRAITKNTSRGWQIAGEIKLLNLCAEACTHSQRFSQDCRL